MAYVSTQPGLVSVIDTATNTVTATIPVGGISEGLVALPDGSQVFLADGNSGQVVVIDTATNTIIARIPIGTFPAVLRITPDGSRLYVSDLVLGQLNVLDIATNTIIATPIASGASIRSIKVTPDGSRVYAGDLVGHVFVIDTASNTVLTSFAVARADALAITPGGASGYVTQSLLGQLQQFSTTTNSVTATIPLPGPLAIANPLGITITPDGGTGYVSDGNNSLVDVFDTATNTLVGSPIPVGRAPADIAVTPDGSSVYVTSLLTTNVSVIDTSTNTVTATVALSGTSNFLTIANLTAPFAAFTIDNLVINNNLHEQGDFTLGPNTGGIDLAHQPLTLTVNNFSLTIPAGSFRQVGGNMHFVFNGTVNGFKVNFNLQAEHGSSTQFDFGFDVHGVSIGGPNPANVSLKIGHNSGSTTAPF
ncbi:MAG TPA: hypothetical protein VFF39_14540 [Verrucomicrobiae bacterium]|nr:hypothetical protein [Verrucomicrobiae bacterium]